jgi:hypothetical protein
MMPVQVKLPYPPGAIQTSPELVKFKTVWCGSHWYHCLEKLTITGLVGTKYMPISNMNYSWFEVINAYGMNVQRSRQDVHIDFWQIYNDYFLFEDESDARDHFNGGLIAVSEPNPLIQPETPVHKDEPLWF